MFPTIWFDTLGEALQGFHVTHEGLIPRMHYDAISCFLVIPQTACPSVSASSAPFGFSCAPWNPPALASVSASETDMSLHHTCISYTHVYLKHSCGMLLLLNSKWSSFKSVQPNITIPVKAVWLQSVLNTYMHFLIRWEDFPLKQMWWYKMIIQQQLHTELLNI